MIQEKDVLIFLHMPKAGGATFRDILKRQYSRAETVEIENRDIVGSLNHFAEQSEAEKLNVRCIVGHMGYGIHHFLPPQSNPIYMTMIRNPVKRVLSLYNFVNTRPNHYLYKPSRGMSFLEFALSDLTPELDNGQTRIIATDACTDLGMNALHRITEEDFSRATNRLDEGFGFVGIMEEYDTCLMLMKQLRQWDNICYFSKHVSKPKKPAEGTTLTSEIMAAVAQRNGFDMRLHEYARSWFQRAMSKYNGDISADLASFKEINRQYNLYRAPILKSLYMLRNALKFIKDMATHTR